MVSMPEGICSKETLHSSSASSMRRPKPSSLFIMALSMDRSVKFLCPAMPVMVRSFSISSGVSTIIVPGWEGSLVLRMLVGMPALRTGKIASSCSTVAPM